MANEASAPEDVDGYDLHAYVKGSPEERLRILHDAHGAATNERYKIFLEGQMIGVTVDFDEHPDWFDEACLCESCRSYGD